MCNNNTDSFSSWSHLTLQTTIIILVAIETTDKSM